MKEEINKSAKVAIKEINTAICKFLNTIQELPEFHTGLPVSDAISYTTHVFYIAIFYQFNNIVNLHEVTDRDHAVKASLLVFAKILRDTAQGMDN